MLGQSAPRQRASASRTEEASLQELQREISGAVIRKYKSTDEFLQDLWLSLHHQHLESGQQMNGVDVRIGAVDVLCKLGPNRCRTIMSKTLHEDVARGEKGMCSVLKDYHDTDIESFWKYVRYIGSNDVADPLFLYGVNTFLETAAPQNVSIAVARGVAFTPLGGGECLICVCIRADNTLCVFERDECLWHDRALVPCLK